jgi:hypothetical protein
VLTHTNGDANDGGTSFVGTLALAKSSGGANRARTLCGCGLPILARIFISSLGVGVARVVVKSVVVVEFIELLVWG